MAETRGLNGINSKVGSFVLLSLLVAGTGLYLAGRAQGWFEKTLTIQTQPIAFSADSNLALQNGADVQILGNTVGSVEEVNIYEQTSGAEPGLRLQFTMRIRGKMIGLVRKDSRVVIQRRFGVAGSAYVQITPGHGAEATLDSPLACAITRDLTKMVEETLDSVISPDSPLQKSLANLQVVTGNLAAGKGTVGKLLHDDAAAQSLTVTLANIEKLTDSLSKGQGTAGALLADTQAGDQIKASVKSLNDSLGSLRTILGKAEGADINGMFDQVRLTLKRMEAALVEVTATTAMLRAQAKDLPILMAESQEMMRQTTRMLEGMQRSWLLRDYVTPDGKSRVSPVDVSVP